MVLIDPGKYALYDCNTLGLCWKELIDARRSCLASSAAETGRLFARFLHARQTFVDKTIVVEGVVIFEWLSAVAAELVCRDQELASRRNTKSSTM